MTDTLADALPREIARVQAKKERWQSCMRDQDMGIVFRITINMMQTEIEAATRACASGDAIEMLDALESLKEYSDDD